MLLCVTKDLHCAFVMSDLYYMYAMGSNYSIECGTP